MGNVGAGQFYPGDGNSDFSVATFIIRQLLALVDTMKVVQVVAVHPGAGSPPLAGTVDVQILVAQLDGSGNSVPNGVVYGLPYFRLGGGKWSVVCDPAIKDIGLAVCADRDISALKAAVASGGSPMVNPGSYRKHDVADGIYLGGCLNAATAASLWLKPDGSFNLTDAFGNVLSSSAGGFALSGNLAITGSITATGEVTAKQGSGPIALSVLRVQGVTTGASQSGPPVPGT